jgi:hypothetical protein
MSDVVERLRAPGWPKKTARRELCDEAADEIERLRYALLTAERERDEFRSSLVTALGKLMVAENELAALSGKGET